MYNHSHKTNANSDSNNNEKLKFTIKLINYVYQCGCLRVEKKWYRNAASRSEIAIARLLKTVFIKVACTHSNREHKFWRYKGVFCR